jgi:hypothetical protein
MSDPNKRNLVFFEGSSMRGLYDSMDKWQRSHDCRLLSVSIQQDQGNYCCIALAGPAEVVITDEVGLYQAGVDNFGRLRVGP